MKKNPFYIFAISLLAASFAFAGDTPPTSWFDGRTTGIIGGVLGIFWGLYGGAVGCVGGFLVPRGKGRKLMAGMLIFGFVMGLVHLLAGLAALLFFRQPYHVWYPFVLVGGIGVFIYFILLKVCKKFILHPPSPISQP